MCNGRARKKAFYKVFHTALMVGLVRGGGREEGLLQGLSYCTHGWAGERGGPGRRPSTRSFILHSWLGW